MNEENVLNFVCVYQRVLGTVSAIFWLLWQCQGQDYKKALAYARDKEQITYISSKRHRNTNIPRVALWGCC